MSIGLLLLILTLAVTAYLLLGRWSQGRRERLGIDAGPVVSADDSILHTPTLRSHHLGLAGRRDHLLRVGDAYVPVEHKPSARRLYRSHRLQVGALCLLVQELYQARPPYAVVILADGVREHVPFTEELEQDVRQTMVEMRRILATDQAPGRRWVAAKCRACGHFPVCWSNGQESVDSAAMDGPPRSAEARS